VGRSLHGFFKYKKREREKKSEMLESEALSSRHVVMAGQFLYSNIIDK